MGLVLSEEFLGVFVMEKRRESMETHSEGKDGDPRDHQKHNHDDIYIMMKCVSVCNEK